MRMTVTQWLDPVFHLFLLQGDTRREIVEGILKMQRENIRESHEKHTEYCTFIYLLAVQMVHKYTVNILHKRINEQSDTIVNQPKIRTQKLGDISRSPSKILFIANFANKRSQRGPRGARNTKSQNSLSHKIIICFFIHCWLLFYGNYVNCCKKGNDRKFEVKSEAFKHFCFLRKPCVNSHAATLAVRKMSDVSSCKQTHSLKNTIHYNHNTQAQPYTKCGPTYMYLNTKKSVMLLIHPAVCFYLYSLKLYNDKC